MRPNGRLAGIVPLYKGKCDPQDLVKNIGMSLQSVVGKRPAKVLTDRLVESTGSGAGQERCGSRKYRFCSDQIFVEKQTREKIKANKKMAFRPLVDLEKAYDRVDNEAKWQRGEIHGV